MASRKRVRTLTARGLPVAGQPGWPAQYWASPWNLATSAWRAAVEVPASVVYVGVKYAVATWAVVTVLRAMGVALPR